MKFELLIAPLCIMSGCFPVLGPNDVVKAKISEQCEKAEPVTPMEVEDEAKRKELEESLLPSVFKIGEDESHIYYVEPKTNKLVVIPKKTKDKGFKARTCATKQILSVNHYGV